MQLVWKIRIADFKIVKTDLPQSRNSLASLSVSKFLKCTYEVGRPAAIGTVMVFDFGVQR